MGFLYSYVHVFFWSSSIDTRLTSLSFQAGLFSAVLTAFVVPQIQTLQVNSTDQSVYYQNQSAQILDRISQQLASVGGQIPTNVSPPPPYPTPPSPYPPFHPLASDRRVNVVWLISLICSLSAALLATLVQQWYRAYMSVLQKSRDPLKAARVRLFLFEGIERIPAVAEAVPGLIHLSLILFFVGLCDYIRHIDLAVFVATLVPVVVCVGLYFYSVVEPAWNPQSPFRSGFIWYLVRELPLYYKRLRGKVVRLAKMQVRQIQSARVDVRQIQSAMEPTEKRKKRDMHAIQWLVDNLNGRRNDMETFVLSIPGSFNLKGGREVWKRVVSDGDPGPVVDPPSSPREGSTVSNLCKFVRYFFETYSIEGDLMDTKERRRRMRGCVETAASIVCCTGVKLVSFGEVEEVLSDLGDKERTNDPLTIISNPLFTVRWTCLSLVAIQKMLDSDRVQEQARMALDGIARFQTGFGNPDTLTAAQRIDYYLKDAGEHVLKLHVAFEPWTQARSNSEIKGILSSHEASIRKLEGIAIETDDMKEVDWRISLLQDAMDDATHNLTRRLPGISFNKLKDAAPMMINEVFDVPPAVTTPAPPQLIFPGQRIQSLCNLGRRLRDIINGPESESHEETIKSFESLCEIPITLHRLDHPIKRQLWRLMDLGHGGGLGFTIELFFLAFGRLSSASLSEELKKDFYSGTFKAITSNWEESKDSAGTERVLLDLLCDLVIRRRGLFSDFSYPAYITDMLLELVKDMIEGHGGKHPHINDVIEELEDESLSNRMNNDLRVKARIAIAIVSSSDTDMSSDTDIQGVINGMTPKPVPAQQPEVADRTIPHPAPFQTARSLSRTASTASKRERMHRNEMPSQDSKTRSRSRSEPQQPPQSLKSSSSQNPRARAETLVPPKRSDRRDSRPPMPGESSE